MDRSIMKLQITKPNSPSRFQVLGYFNQQKKQRGVDEALVRLYQPILWRAFKVANPLVRANAAALLVDAFPLQNPDASNEEVDSLLQKQFDLLQDLLEDPFPIVRATGVHGVCRIAGVFWELIPVHTIKCLLTKLICQVAFDSSSSAVRLAVFQGLKFLVENHLSHPLLKTLLGSLRDLIHDVSEKVRAAFVDLLLLVKGMKAIKFWTIVPLEHLLGRLEVETSAPVLRKLVKLLMNSFHPLNKEPDVQVTRCTALWEANAVAARKFYQYAHLHTPVPATGKFLVLLCRCLVQWAKSSSTEDSLLTEENRTNVTENKENESIEEPNEAMLTLPDADTVAGLIETIAISWAGVKDQLDKKANESIKAKMIQQFTKALPKLLASSEDARTRAAVIFIAGNLPASSLPNFSNKCLNTLSSLEEGISTQDFGPMLDCLCSWGKAGEVLDLIQSCLLTRIGGVTAATSMGRRKDRRAEQKAGELKATVALDFLSWLLYQPACRTAVLERHEKLRCIVGVLKSVTILIESMASSPSSATGKRSKSNYDELYPKALKMYCHVQIHLHNTKESGSSEAASDMTDLLIWGKRILLPALDIHGSSTTTNATEGAKRPNDDEEDDNSYRTREFLEIILSCSSEMIKLGIADEMFCVQLTALTKSLTQLGAKSLPLLPHLSGLMYQMSQRVNFLEEDDDSSQTDHTQAMLADILRTISGSSSAENLTQVLLGIRSPLTEVLKSYECKRQAVIAGFADRPQIMATTMAATVAEVAHHDAGDQSSVPDLPPLTSFLVGIFVKSKALLRSFVEELEQCVLSGALQDASSLRAVVVLLAAVTNSNTRVDNLKTCVLQVQQQLEEVEKNSALCDSDAARRHIVAAKELAKITLDKLGIVS